MELSIASSIMLEIHLEFGPWTKPKHMEKPSEKSSPREKKKKKKKKSEPGLACSRLARQRGLEARAGGRRPSGACIGPGGH